MTNDNPTSTPEAIILAAFTAMNTGDWHGLAALCDPHGRRLFESYLTPKMLESHPVFRSP